MERQCRCGRPMAKSGVGEDDLGLCLAHSLEAFLYARDHYKSGYTDGHGGAPRLQLSDLYGAGYDDGQVASGRVKPSDGASSWPHLWRAWTGLLANGPRFMAFASMMAGLDLEDALEFAATVRRRGVTTTTEPSGHGRR